MAYWLVKSEPESFSWQEQLRRGVEPWTGVRNALAAQHLRAMRLGDEAFFYHSNTGREVVGRVAVAREHYPDPTDPTGRWVCVDVRALAPLRQPVPLAAIKAAPELDGIALVRQTRLSVMPVSPQHWHAILRLAGEAAPASPALPASLPA